MNQSPKQNNRCAFQIQYEDDVPLTPENFEKKGQSLLLVTVPIKMIKGGIPKHNPQFHDKNPDSMKRAYFFIPKNPEDPNSMELFDAMDRIDDYMTEEINEKENVNGVLCALNKNGKRIKLKGLTYTKIVSTAKPGGNTLDLEDDDDDDDKHKKTKNSKSFKDDSKKEFVPWDRIKVRLSTIYDKDSGT